MPDVRGRGEAGACGCPVCAAATSAAGGRLDTCGCAHCAAAAAAGTPAAICAYVGSGCVPGPAVAGSGDGGGTAVAPACSSRRWAKNGPKQCDL